MFSMTRDYQTRHAVVSSLHAMLLISKINIKGLFGSRPNHATLCHTMLPRLPKVRGCLVLGLALPHFAIHFCQACLRLVHQKEKNKLASLWEA